jgi:hypothetical protein
MLASCKPAKSPASLAVVREGLQQRLRQSGRAGASDK